jgi:hypothetical protein
LTSIHWQGKTCWVLNLLPLFREHLLFLKVSQVRYSNHICQLFPDLDPATSCRLYTSSSRLSVNDSYGGRNVADKQPSMEGCYGGIRPGFLFFGWL